EIKLSKVVRSSLTQISCDKGRLEQALWNLLSNAVKFTPPGGSVTLEVTNSLCHLIFSVTDTGRGIASGDLPHVFDRHWQKLDQRFCKSAQGLGLGLFIVKQ